MANLHTKRSRASEEAPRGRHVLRPARSTTGPRSRLPSLERGLPLPGGRAVIGALLVTIAAVGVFAALRSANEGPTQPVVVAATELPAGHRLQPGDLRLERAELPAGAASQAFDSVASLDGGVTVAPLRAGELVQQSAVLSAGAAGERGNREFSFGVDRERALNGDLQQGEHVDVLATFGTNDGAYTAVVARDVTLANVEGAAKTNSLGSSGKLTITVSLASGDDVLRLAHATQVAPITLVRTTRAEGSDPGTLDTYRAPAAKSDAAALPRQPAPPGPTAAGGTTTGTSPGPTGSSSGKGT